MNWPMPVIQFCLCSMPSGESWTAGEELIRQTRPGAPSWIRALEDAERWSTLVHSNDTPMRTPLKSMIPCEKPHWRVQKHPMCPHPISSLGASLLRLGHTTNLTGTWRLPRVRPCASTPPAVLLQYCYCQPVDICLFYCLFLLRSCASCVKSRF